MVIETRGDDGGIPEHKKARLLAALTAFTVVVDECLTDFPEDEALQFASGYANTVRAKLFPSSPSPARPPRLERSK